MKFKLLLVSSLLAVSYTNYSLADSSVTIAYGERVMDNVTPKTYNNKIRNVMGISVKTKLSESFDGDIGMNQVVAHGTNASTNRVETGLTYNYRLTDYPLKLTFRTAVGEKTSSSSTASSQSAYYAFTPGALYSFGSGIDVGVSYRYRDAFNTASYADRSNTMSYALAYHLTKKDRIAVVYSNQTMDGANKQTVLAYTRKF
jgi:hypothetical protein